MAHRTWILRDGIIRASTDESTRKVSLRRDGNGRHDAGCERRRIRCAAGAEWTGGDRLWLERSSWRGLRQGAVRQTAARSAASPPIARQPASQTPVTPAPPPAPPPLWVEEAAGCTWWIPASHRSEQTLTFSDRPTGRNCATMDGRSRLRSQPIGSGRPHLETKSGVCYSTPKRRAFRPA